MLRFLRSPLQLIVTKFNIFDITLIEFECVFHAGALVRTSLSEGFPTVLTDVGFFSSVELHMVSQRARVGQQL